MSFTIDLYIFPKKANSTSIPTTGAVNYNCILKDQSSIINPVIGFDIGLANSPAASNYAYIPSFNRYYFIKDWTFKDALWWATLEIDVLASWKTQIAGLECYVTRSASSSNGALLDNTYPGTGNTTLIESQIDSPWQTGSLDDGMFVVGIAGESTTYYLFTKDMLDYVLGYLFSDLFADALTSGWSLVFPSLKAQCNPLQYITSIMWIPFQTVAQGTGENIKVGWVDVPAVGWKISGSSLRYGQSDFTVQRHPQAARGKYLNNAPYSNYALFYPPFGLIPIDADIMANTDTISVLWGVDLRTGQATLTIAAGTAHIQTWTHAQVGLNFQVSQVLNKGFGIGNLIAPAIGAGVSAATGNAAAVALTGAAEIGNFAASKIPHVSTIGTNGGMDTLRGVPALQYEFKEIAAEDNQRRGRPLCAVVQIGTLSGYIKAANVNIQIAGTQEERQAIINFMEGGFFYE